MSRLDRMERRLGILDEAEKIIMDKIMSQRGQGSVGVRLVRHIITLMTMYELSISDGVKLNENFGMVVDGIYGEYPGLEEVISRYLRGFDDANTNQANSAN